MKEKLRNNWGLKLISVGLAVFMWLFVINVNHPVESKKITVHKVEYLNEDVIINDNKTFSVDGLESRGIDITVQVLKQDANKVKADDFQIVIDLAKVGPYGATEIDVEWLGSDQYKIDESTISWKTATVQVTLEDIRELSFTVQCHIVGEPADGYIVGDTIKLDPTRVKIKAPMSVMEQIRSVGIEVDVEGLSSEAVGTARLKLYDVAGEELNLNYEEYEDFEFSMSQEEIRYSVPLLKTKEVPLRPQGYSGQVAEGYRYTDILWSDQTVHIAGLRAVMADIDYIDIPAEVFNLDGATENVVIQIDVSQYVPEGVTVEGDNIVTVTLVVEPLIQQTRHLMPEQIRIEGGQDGWKYTIHGSVEVVIEGLEEDLNALTDEMLDAWLSAGGMKSGSNTAQVHVSVDNAFTLIRVGEAVVTMEEIPETESDSDGSNSGASDAETGSSESTQEDGSSGTSGSSSGANNGTEATTTASGAGSSSGH